MKFSELFLEKRYGFRSFRMNVGKGFMKHVVLSAGGTILVLAILAIIGVDSVRGEEKARGSKAKSQTSLRKVAGVPNATLMNINNLAMWASDNGSLERRPQDGNSGVTFPRGTSTAIYAGGLIWGGLVQDGSSPKLRVGGQTYNYGTVAGRIISRGVKENANNPDVHIYRIRRDWKTADLSRDAAEFNDKPLGQVTPDDIEALRAQYKKDWIEWPWQKGAPYYDRNNNGKYDPDPSGLYDPAQDEPGLGGADQVLWFVCNDLDASAARGLYGSPPVGIEMQVTCWAYARTDELGNVIFQRNRIIYKGTASTPPNARIDSMYLAKWSDPDLGDYGDDYAGCVIDKSLGYVYNSTPSDAEYKKFDLSGGAGGGPPVAGYDFFQGPRVPSPGGKARWDLKTIDGYENLPMTTFAFFAAGGRDSDPDLSNYEGTKQWYNLLRGYRPRPADPPECFIDPTTGQCTKFELAGDPNTFRGWIDGRRDPPGDRRLVLASGPFTMALGDTQEVVVGLIGAMGADYLDGINVLKKIDDVAQDAFNLSFELPERVPEPTLNIVELDQKFILDWESDTAQLRKIESYNSKGYKFESYNIYQFPIGSATLDQAKLVRPFDPSTEPRSMQITEDKFRAKPLVNGQRYYFAVSATVFNPDPALVKQRLESSIGIKVAIPHSPDPGVVYPYAIDEPLDIIQNAIGVNDAIVTTAFYDPTKVTNHTYKIRFHVPPAARARWDLIDVTARDTLIRSFPIDTSSQRMITRGFTVQVNSSPVGVKGILQSKYGGAETNTTIFNIPNPEDGKYMLVGQGSSSIDTVAGNNTDDRDIEWRFDEGTSWALLRGSTADVRTSNWIRVPYTAWQLSKSPSDTDRQINTVIHAVGKDSIWRVGTLLDRQYNGRTLQVFYPVSFVVSRRDLTDLPYYEDTTEANRRGVKATLHVNTGTNKEAAVAVNRVYVADLDGDGVAVPSGTTIRFEKYKVIQDGDEKVFTPENVQRTNLDAARTEIEKINVFPNPYYGLNRSELSRYSRFVTFNHLPAKATIRIFNLAGTLVRTISKQESGQSSSQFTTWDLTNEQGLPVASGLYIAHMELADALGRNLGTKTLKLMIVLEQQFLDSY